MSTATVTKPDEYLSMGEVARVAPMPVTTASIWYWVRTGLIGRDGTKVKLPVVKRGGRFYVERAALERWLAEVGSAPAGI